MWKKRILCLVLVLCSILVLSSCQKKETFMTLDQQQQQQQQQQQTASQSSDAQNLFGETALPQQTAKDWDSGDYNPASEEGGDEEFLENLSNIVDVQTPAPTMKSEYAGATPVLVDPIDKPTPTPLPPLTFSYQKYTASALHLTFEGPVGWVEDDSMPDTYILTNPTAGVDYAAQLSIQLVPVDKARNKNELIKEVKTRLDEIGGTCLKYERSQTAGRKFMNVDGVYANYKATTLDGAKIAGRMIISCVNKTLYILHVSYPQGYTGDYVDKVYDKFRHTVKIIDTTAAAATKTN
ncbi:hypothetical protein JRC49_02320 [Clostridiales bacterium FE2011]|nr:hypothetical protein JRC49_02320 [Clostridiales bacterium FE2011]QTE75648.1 hypothetical protein JS518_07150 [Clostridiales bacterium FE2010]